MKTSHTYIRLVVAHNFADRFVDRSSEEFITDFNSWVDDWSDSLVEDYEGLILDTAIPGEFYLTIPMDQFKEEVLSKILMFLGERVDAVTGYSNLFCTEHPKFEVMRWHTLSGLLRHRYEFGC